MRRPRRARSLTSDEAELWRAVMKDAAPLPKRRARKPTRDVPFGESTPEPPPAEPPPIPPIPKPAPKSRIRQPEPPPPPTPASRPHALAHGETAGIDRRTAGRFTRGRMEIDGHIDLHGMTQETAHRALCAFLARAHDRGSRCVIVVTGKGSRGGEGGGVLRRMVPMWLNEPGLRTRILSFTHAQPQHGGEGALYVLLKRHRA